MDNGYLSSVVVEVVGISVVSVGIGYELTYSEPVGYILITVGSVVVCIGSLLYAKVYSHLKKNK